MGITRNARITLCVQNTEVYNVTAGGTRSNHRPLRFNFYLGYISECFWLHVWRFKNSCQEVLPLNHGRPTFYGKVPQPLSSAGLRAAREQITSVTLISGLRRDVDEICDLLGNYTRRRVITQKITDFK
jgi:hypothetical protein